jgi:hypothetical protein
MSSQPCPGWISSSSVDLRMAVDQRHHLHTAQKMPIVATRQIADSPELGFDIIAKRSI